MATLEQEVMDLKTRLARLEAVMHRLVSDASQAEGSVPAAPLEQSRLLAWLKAHGLVRDPTTEECRVAAEWDVLSDEDKQSHIDSMQRLDLDPLLSQIIIEQRR
jgi:hypothetical protein